MTQQGVGSTPGYDAIDARRFWGVAVQEGVITAGSYEVTQRGAGSNLSVDIAASTGDGALVKGEAVTGQGPYLVPPHTAVINEAITTANATNPRIDQVVLEIKDTTHDASGSNLAQTRVVTGTATGGATLDNRTGAAALPASALLLADVLVAATDTAISNSEIRDRRPWARGAYRLVTRTAGDYTTSSASLVAIDSTNLNVRLECSGVPVRVRLAGSATHSVATGVTSVVQFGLNLDGAGINGSGSIVGIQGNTSSAPMTVALEYVFTPAVGSHLFAPTWVTGAPTATLRATAASPLTFTVEELVRQNTANNSTTSG